MKKQTEDNKTSYRIAIFNGFIAIVTTAITVFFGSQLHQLQNLNQQVNVNIINTLGEDVTSEMHISRDSNIEHVTNELAQSYLSISQDNRELRDQVENLTEFILEKYPSNEVDHIVAEGYVKETSPTRLDMLEKLDGELCKVVPSVRDMYGTTHSVSYEMLAKNEGGVAWAKFKLDGEYDRFSANIITSEDTARDACMSVEIYVDNYLVSRVDNIIRDERVRPISAVVNGGNVLEIKVIGTANTYYNVCYISDGELTKLE